MKKLLLKTIPWFFLGLFTVEMIAVLAPKKEGEFHLREFSRLPVLLNGRVQPIDSVGRNSLLQIRSTAELPLEVVPSWQFWKHPKKLKPGEWLLEVFTKPELADTRPIFLIHHAEILGELRLEEKGIEKSGLRYYTFNELKPVLNVISEQGRKASQLKAEERTTFHQQMLKLANAMMLYQRLKVSLQPEGTHNFAADLAAFQAALPAAQRVSQSNDEESAADREILRKIAQPVRRYQMMAEYAYPLIVPPLKPDEDRNAWLNAGASLLESLRTGTVHPAMTHYAAMATAYHANQAPEFNRAVAEYWAWLQPQFGGEARKARAEFYFNNIKTFLHATIIYIAAFVLALCAVVSVSLTPNLAESLRRSAFYLVILAALVHTAGLIFRMVLEGRPPVTNLYSSAIFIGWGVAIMGIILERMYRVGLGVIVGAFAGFVTLLIAHNLGMGGDTMEMMRAVLDTNFWLATHVVVITLGYSACFAAGLLAILYIFLGLFSPLLTRPAAALDQTVAPQQEGQTLEIGQALSRMVYAIICFATLFSFLGTVLGGIWADQSWGRFWGWDPKENGALLIVIWCAIILHARWAGMIQERGLMNLTIFGNIVTAFSWFGVNMLGVGLHSYGFMDSGFKWLVIFFVSQMAVIGLGCLPLSLWRSFRTPAAAAAPRPAAGPGRTTAPATS